MDFGTVTNTQATMSYITITFTITMIDAGLATNTDIWISAGAEYFSGTEVWIGQSTMTYITSTEPVNIYHYHYIE